MATLFEKDELCEEKYLTEFPGFYSAGDAGYVSEDGYMHVMARTDDVINVAGHRLSSGALEEACLTHTSVVEAAVVGVKDDLKGSLPIALVVVSAGSDEDDADVASEVVAPCASALGLLRL